MPSVFLGEMSFSFFTLLMDVILTRCCLLIRRKASAVYKDTCDFAFDVVCYCEEAEFL